MTVVVAVKVSDGLVFAADSAQSLIGRDASGSETITNVYNSGNKVFNLMRGLPICATTFGLGSMSGQSIGTLAKDLRLLLSRAASPRHVDPANYRIEDIAKIAGEFFFNDCYSNDPNRPTGEHAFGFWIGGYSSNSSLSEHWAIEIINGQYSGPKCLSTAAADHALTWAGQPEAITRLISGYSSGLPDYLLQAGANPQDLPALMAGIAARSEAPLIHPAMPVQDAIELADFLVHATKMYFRFHPGANSVGGDTDICSVTKHEGFKWIKRKHFYSAAFNPLETDHVS